MDKSEELMAMFPDINYIYDKNMPPKQGGLYIDGCVYLDPKQSKAERTSYLSEELGHYLTSVGDITLQDTTEKRKQERKARDIGAIMLVTPYDIIDCFEDGCKTSGECAEFLGVTEQTFKDAISYYSRRFDGIKTKNNYTIYFNLDGTVSVCKVF